MDLKEELSQMSFDDLLKLKSVIGTKVFNSTAFKRDEEIKTKNNILKRKNKNRPSEVSSKCPFKKFKAKPAISINYCKNARDPRFDETAGELNEDLFHQSYSFIDDLEKKEIKKIEKLISKEKSPEKKEKLKNLQKRMIMRQKNKEIKYEKKLNEKKLRKDEKEKILKGKAPFYLKKSEKKKLLQQEKLNLIEEKGKMNKYMKKMDKRQLQKDRKHLTFL